MPRHFGSIASECAARVTSVHLSISGDAMEQNLTVSSGSGTGAGAEAPQYTVSRGRFAELKNAISRRRVRA
jgi:hypothetical protein